MKTKFAVLVGAALLLLTTQAWADCSGTLVNLGANNVGLGGSLQFCVTVGGDGNTDWTLYGDTGDLSNSGNLVFISQFDWNGSAVFDAATSNSGWVVPNGPHPNGFEADGFGSFDNEVANPGNDQGIGTVIEFLGAGPTTVAVHAGFDNCTGWFTNAQGAQTNTSSGQNCGGSDVPEPATLTLLGTGLVGLGGVLRRRLRK